MGALDLVVRGRGSDVVIQMGVMTTIMAAGLVGFTIYKIAKEGPRKFFGEFSGALSGFREWTGDVRRAF